MTEKTNEELRRQIFDAVSELRARYRDEDRYPPDGFLRHYHRHGWYISESGMNPSKTMMGEREIAEYVYLAYLEHFEGTVPE